MRLITDIDFSLIIPTRNRLSLLKKCLSSFFDKASDFNRIEALVLADFDDPETTKFHEYIDLNKFNGRVIFGKQFDRMIHNYNNYAAQCSVGKYVWMLNDDIEIVTDKWDEIIRDRVENFLVDKPDRIAYVHVDDSTHTNWGTQYVEGCCVPILTREAIDAVNCIMPGEIDSWGGDISLYRIYKSLRANRILDIISEVKVLHHCRHNNSVAPDETAKRVERISRKLDLTHDEYLWYINKLNEKLF